MFSSSEGEEDHDNQTSNTLTTTSNHPTHPYYPTSQARKQPPPPPDEEDTTCFLADACWADLLLFSGPPSAPVDGTTTAPSSDSYYLDPLYDDYYYSYGAPGAGTSSLNEEEEARAREAYLARLAQEIHSGSFYYMKPQDPEEPKKSQNNPYYYHVADDTDSAAENSIVVWDPPPAPAPQPQPEESTPQLAYRQEEPPLVALEEHMALAASASSSVTSSHKKKQQQEEEECHNSVDKNTDPSPLPQEEEEQHNSWLSSASCWSSQSVDDNHVRSNDLLDDEEIPFDEKEDTVQPFDEDPVEEEEEEEEEDDDDDDDVELDANTIVILPEPAMMEPIGKKMKRVLPSRKDRSSSSSSTTTKSLSSASSSATSVEVLQLVTDDDDSSSDDIASDEEVHGHGHYVYLCAPICCSSSLSSSSSEESETKKSQKSRAYVNQIAAEILSSSSPSNDEIDNQHPRQNQDATPTMSNVNYDASLLTMANQNVAKSPAFTSFENPSQTFGRTSRSSPPKRLRRRRRSRQAVSQRSSSGLFRRRSRQTGPPQVNKTKIHQQDQEWGDDAPQLFVTASSSTSALPAIVEVSTWENSSTSSAGENSLVAADPVST